MMRWRYGAENRVTEIAGNTIEIGDLCYKYGNYVYSVRDGDPSFHWVKTFLGVAMTAAKQGALYNAQAPTVQIATSGVFEFPIETEAFLDNFVTAAYRYCTRGPDDCETEVTIQPQLVCVSSEDYAIGQIVKAPYWSDTYGFGPREWCALIEIQSRAA